jgi:hypothetical protein
MTFLTRLDVVNEMLASMGEAPLNTEDEGHPLYPQASRMLDVASYRTQARAWWFNTELLQLSPDAASSFVYLPDDTIRVDPREPSLNYVQRGRRLYNPAGFPNQDPYKFSAPVTVWLVRHLPFGDLPVPAQLAVSYAAQVDFQRSFDADPNKYQQLVLQAREAMLHLNADHIRNQNVNLLHTPSVVETMNRVAPRGLTYR